MHSSDEGKWGEEALDLQAATPVIILSLMMRYCSLENDAFTGKIVAALRNGLMVNNKRTVPGTVRLKKTKEEDALISLACDD